jgi:hypothetical protein
MAEAKDVWARNRGKTLAQVLTRKPAPVIPPAPPQGSVRGGSEMSGPMTLPPSPRPLPFWWPR